MFTTAHPRVATPHGGTSARTTTGGRAARVVASLTALALGGAFALAAPLAAAADESSSKNDAVAYARAQFLGGSLLGIDLDAIAKVNGVEAANNGSQPTQVDKDPLSAEVLQAITVESKPAPQIDLGGVLQFGPVSQYARAQSNGSSYAATGAISDDGAVGVGGDTSTPPSNATLDLEELLGTQFAKALADLRLEFGGITARAQANGTTASGDYQIADAFLVFQSPAIAKLTPKVNSALAQVEDALAQLVGRNGDLVEQVNKLLVDLDPLLNLLGGKGKVSASIDVGDLQSLVASLLKASYSDSGISFDLETGQVRVDLAAFVGGDLNDLAPGTELLTDKVVNKILTTITTTVSKIAEQVVAKVTSALHDAKVAIHVDLSTDVAQSPIVKEVCEVVETVITKPVLGDVSLLEGLQLIASGLVKKLTGDVLPKLGDFVYDATGAVKKVVDFVNETVQKTVCRTETTPLPALTTGATVDIVATVDQLIAGIAAQASAKLEVLGIPVKLDLDLLLERLGLELLDGLFDNDGAIQSLVAALQGKLVSPAVTTLTGSGPGTVGDALRNVVSVTANNQEVNRSTGEFTQTALRVSVVGDGVARVDLAEATVGPNVTAIDDCTDPDGCEPGGPGDPGDPGDPPGGGGSAGGGNLAYTGVGIATLLAVILALLAAGAYLVREGYRKAAATR